MSKRIEGNEKTTSVIARLMGLDESAPQQPLHRQQKVLSDDYLRKTSSIGLVGKRSIRDKRLSQTSPEKMHKNLCVSEISKLDKKINPNPRMKATHTSFSRQRNIHAKHLSEDEKLFHFKGFDDMVGDVQSDNSLKHYHHPNLSVKHFGDLEGLQSEQHSVWLSEYISGDGDNEVCKKLDEMSSQRIGLRSCQKSYHHSGQTYIGPLDNLKTMFDLRDRSAYFSRRIVLLKPNSDYIDHKEILKPNNGELSIEGAETGYYPDRGLEPRRCSFRITRAAAKQTQVGKTNTCSSFGGFSRSTAGAEKASPNVSEKISSSKSFDYKRRDCISYPFPSRSLFAMEAKKQIFERWKSTKGFQEVEVDSRRRTLVEMFVMHDGGVRSNGSSVNISQSSHEGKKLVLGSPLCVGNKYSTKDMRIWKSRLEFLKRSSTSHLNPIDDASQNGSCHQYTGTEDGNNLKNKVFQRNDSQKYGEDNAALKADNNMDRETESKAAVPFINELPEIGQNILPTRDKNTTSSDVWENLIPPQISSFDSSGGEHGSSCTSDQDLSINLKEMNQQHSPISVLEPLFKEENPFASEFYNNPLSDLSGLAMKLALLNSNSDETNSECSGMNVSSDGDNERGSSTDVPKYDKKLWDMSRPQESRDYSYLVDVLDEANLCDRNLDNLHQTWLSTEYPVDPSLFETLEKKYGKQASWLKSDRKLLFDRVNTGLKEIMDSFMDIQISGERLMRRFRPTLRRDEIEEELWILLLDQEKEVSKNLSGKALGKEMKWLELREDISCICREIEADLFNELVAELD